jgi:hypothetical protein
LTKLLCASVVGATSALATSASANVSSATIVSIAKANVGKGACSTNSTGGKSFASSCTGNGGSPEYWCADFALWVWEQAGADVSGLTAAAGSFYVYGQNHGTLHQTPSLGDAIVFNYQGGGYADHVAIVTTVNSNGTIETVSGDWGGQSGTEAQFASTSHVVLNTPAYSGTDGSYASEMGYTISGYISPISQSCTANGESGDCMDTGVCASGGGQSTAGSCPGPSNIECCTMAPPPRGFLDQADCTSVGGWAQDPSVPTQGIFADVYFNAPAGGSGATGIRLTADVSRQDLCTALGSCDHAFLMPTPRSTLNGASHSVYAYGINHTSGGANTLLTNSPRNYTCPAPAIPAGDVKRHVTNPTIFGDWQFDGFTDMASYTTAEIGAVPDGVDIGAPPSLVQVTGTAPVYVVDGNFYRHVVDPASFSAWRFTTAQVKSITASALGALQPGPDWPAAPLLVNDPSAPPVYLLDVPLVAPAGATPAGDAGAGAPGDGGSPSVGLDGGPSWQPEGGSNGDASTSQSGGCSLTRTGGRGEIAWGSWLAIAAILAVRSRRARTMA